MIDIEVPMKGIGMIEIEILMIGIEMIDIEVRMIDIVMIDIRMIDIEIRTIDIWITRGHVSSITPDRHHDHDVRRVTQTIMMVTLICMTNLVIVSEILCGKLKN